MIVSSCFDADSWLRNVLKVVLSTNGSCYEGYGRSCAMDQYNILYLQSGSSSLGLLYKGHCIVFLRCDFG